jgi:serine/threonine protein kinase
MPRSFWVPPSLSLPCPYDDYRLINRIGGGGMGEVWEAFSPQQPGERLVIKFLTGLGLSACDDRWLAQFRCEAKAGIRVTHQYVARTHAYLDLGRLRGQGWPPAALVMSWYPVSLGQVLRETQTTKQGLPARVASELARNLAEALRELHVTYGLVHRDVKPSNVLLRLPEGIDYTGPANLDGAVALLADFGICCRVGTRPLWHVRQDGFKPPWLIAANGEPLRQQPCVSPCEDLYAFGLVVQALARAVDV